MVSLETISHRFILFRRDVYSHIFHFCIYHLLNGMLYGHFWDIWSWCFCIFKMPHPTDEETGALSTFCICLPASSYYQGPKKSNREFFTVPEGGLLAYLSLFSTDLIITLLYPVSFCSWTVKKEGFVQVHSLICSWIKCKFNYWCVREMLLKEGCRQVCLQS